eukprot:3849514-Amphidinium_carterae.1
MPRDGEEECNNCVVVLAKWLEVEPDRLGNAVVAIIWHVKPTWSYPLVWTVVPMCACHSHIDISPGEDFS